MYEDLVKALRELAEDDNDEAAKAADAIEELQKAVYFHKYNSEFWEDKYNSLADEKWIPVTERLPQEREWVLCQCRAKIRMVLRLQNGYWHQDSRHEFMSGFVTHWQPLPEPKEEV